MSAKILSAPELDRARVLLASVRSGIGTDTNRQVACRHYELTRATGARRVETEKLRWLDVDDDMIRFRPHPGHTLKTPASERVVPLLLVGLGVWDELQALRRGVTQVTRPRANGLSVARASTKSNPRRRSSWHDGASAPSSVAAGPEVDTAGVRL